ncbi:MAG: prephenate dehydratase [Treponemataceae bacterium]|nr:prephenate dehydratase [Spirochaetales bacterium]MDY6030726.1 prephenate dehydratase [Treponemataceae bacterium]
MESEKTSKIAYSGIEGAFANIAAKKIFPNGNLVSFLDFTSAYKAVENGECDYAVLPIENSFAGEVTQVSDLMFTGSLFIKEVWELTIHQNLLGTENSSIDSIKTVISHPQALEQCTSFINEHGWKIQIESNTARAAKKVSELNDKSIAAIASKETAELYGLEILASNINENENNTTRFAVFTKNKKSETEKKSDDTFIMMFTVKNKSGMLAKAINVIGDNDFNMSELRSRPLRKQAWEYYFFVEAQGSVCSVQGRKMIKDLQEQCEMLKIVGSYKIQAIN